MSYYDTQERTLLHGTGGHHEGSYLARSLFVLLSTVVVTCFAFCIFAVLAAPLGYKIAFGFYLLLFGALGFLLKGLYPFVWNEEL